MTTMRSVRFRFDARKAADAAAFLLQRHGGRMNHMRLVKLLYLAERVSLDRFGRPILGDRYVSMKHGPVVSRTYDLIKEKVESAHWSRLIERDSPLTVRLKAGVEPDFGSLSDADIEILEAVTRFCREMDQFKLRDMTHAFPEWRNPGNSSRKIPVEQLLEALGKTQEQIKRIARSADEKRYFERLFRAV